MRCLLPIALAALAFSPVQAHSFMPDTPIAQQTAGDFLKSCGKDSSRCGLAVGSALLDKIEVVSGPAQVCTPTGAELNNPDNDKQRAHPAMVSQPAEDAIFTALVA